MAALGRTAYTQPLLVWFPLGSRRKHASQEAPCAASEIPDHDFSSLLPVRQVDMSSLDSRRWKLDLTLPCEPHTRIRSRRMESGRFLPATVSICTQNTKVSWVAAAPRTGRWSEAQACFWKQCP